MKCIHTIIDFRFISGLTMLIFLGSCDLKKSNPVIEQNIYDSTSVSFKISNTILLNKKTAITANNYTFRWSTESPSNVSRFRLVIDGNEEFVSSSTYEKYVAFLDEGIHSFQVQSVHTNGVNLETTRSDNTMEYTVNPIEGPAVLFYPQSITVRPNVQAEIYVRIKDIPPHHALQSFSFKISHSSWIMLNSIEPADLLNGKSVVGMDLKYIKPFPISLNDIRKDIQFALLNGTVSGSGNLFKIKFMVTETKAAQFKFEQTNSVFVECRDSLNIRRDIKLALTLLNISVK